MKDPKFTDLHKYPNGYTPSNATNVAETFERIRAKQKEEAAARLKNLINIKRGQR